MENVDLKDRRILYELDKNSRESFTQIGKRVGLHKNVVNYRIKRMQDKGIITNFYTVIDTFKLGFNSLRFYIVYQNITPSIRNEIINHFVNNKLTWWVGSFEGEYDLAVVVWIKDMHEFYLFWEKTMKHYQKYFKKQMFCLYCQLRLFRHTFLMKDDYEKTDREKFEITGGGRKVQTDEIDFKILSLIAKDARYPTVQIAEKLGVSVDTVIQRMKRLEKLDVIQAFRVNIDYSKLGFHLFKVNITLNNYSERANIIKYIRYNPHLIMIDKAIGYYDLELDFLLKDLNHLRTIMDDLSEQFPGSLNSYNFVHDPIKHKMVYLPEE